MASFFKIAVICLVMLVVCSNARVIDVDDDYLMDFAASKRGGQTCYCRGGSGPTGGFWGGQNCPAGMTSCRKNILGNCCQKSKEGTDCDI
uniref:N.vectensis toxin 7 n=1 Tax=Nematostella vectensis TaxID=45351 RepID=NV7_NEMVE|nr:RecName: Full=N.vectensis toxin 7; Short=Nv7; Flags: Precursor [Nematostella vectensis]